MKWPALNFSSTNLSGTPLVNEPPNIRICTNHALSGTRPTSLQIGYLKSIWDTRARAELSGDNGTSRPFRSASGLIAAPVCLTGSGAVSLLGAQIAHSAGSVWSGAWFTLPAGSTSAWAANGVALPAV